MPWVGGLALWETFNGVPETGAGEEIIPSNNSGFCSGCFKLLGRSCFEIAACRRTQTLHLEPHSSAEIACSDKENRMR